MKRKFIFIFLIFITIVIISYIIVKPKIMLLGNKHIFITPNHEYIELGAVAVNFNKDISEKIKIEGNVNTGKIGTYKITYKVKANNVVSKITRIVTVTIDPPFKYSTIYLTFDDGPSNITTKLLDVLKEENVKATFFILNWADKYDDVIKRVALEGHTIGLHGYIHSYRRNYRSVEAYFDDLGMIHDKVYATTGVDSKIIRFIGGSSNTISRFNKGIMTKLTDEVQKRGYHYFDWNIDSRDTGHISTTRVFKNVIRRLGDDDTYIVLMHDYDYNLKTVRAIKKIIEYGKDNGYIFGGLTIYTPPTNHKLRN